MTLPDLLTVKDVMSRYGMRDKRTARRLMNQARGFKVGGRLVVREDDLGAHERQMTTTNKPQESGTVTPSCARRERRTGPTPADGPDWWRPTA